MEKREPSFPSSVRETLRITGPQYHPVVPKMTTVEKTTTLDWSGLENPNDGWLEEQQSNL